jgi:hypothetical protein
MSQRVRKEMQKTEKNETNDLLNDRKTQFFLSRFLSSEIQILEPTFNQQGYSYPLVEAVVGDSSLVVPFLSKLYDSGILDKKLFDKIVLCPKCSSTNISFRYCCPFCKSYDIQKSSLVEHVRCGYMDLETNFTQGNKYVCPKCHEEMRRLDVDYRKAGVWCSCRECGKSFDIPVPEHFCRNCHSTSTFEEASIRDVYSYTLETKIKRDYSANCVLISSIEDILIQNGYKVECPAFLRGKSGANHYFDIAAYKEDVSKMMVLDLAKSSADVVSEQIVIALFAKMFDVSPDKAFLIALPRLSENGKRMAELYNIHLVEAKSQSEAAKELVRHL